MSFSGRRNGRLKMALQRAKLTSTAKKEDKRVDGFFEVSPDKERMGDHPHVLQTVALSQETARQQILAGFENWETMGIVAFLTIVVGTF